MRLSRVTRQPGLRYQRSPRNSGSPANDAGVIHRIGPTALLPDRQFVLSRAPRTEAQGSQERWRLTIDGYRERGLQMTRRGRARGGTT
jgi:hypothetical protein